MGEGKIRGSSLSDVDEGADDGADDGRYPENKQGKRRRKSRDG
jgi:hypothetical protein